MGEKQNGTVKWFNSTKGFGFISPAGGGEDLFVHQTSIKTEGFRSLAEGEAVEYHVEAGDDGRTKAIDVTGPAGAAPQGAPRPQQGYGGGRGGGGFGGYDNYGGGGGGYGGGFGGGRGGGRGRGGGYDSYGGGQGGYGGGGYSSGGYGGGGYQSGGGYNQGGGGYGQRSSIAVKCLKRGNRIQERAVSWEAKPQSRLVRTSIVPLLDAMISPTNICVIPESGMGTLADIMDKYPNGLPEIHVQALAQDIVAATHFMANSNVSHRDLKPEDFLVYKTRIGGNFIDVLKLADSGLAVDTSARGWFVSLEEPYPAQTVGMMSIPRKNSDLMSFFQSISRVVGPVQLVDFGRGSKVVKEIHIRGICYNDVKTGNILISAASPVSNPTCEDWTAGEWQIGDFGSAIFKKQPKSTTPNMWSHNHVAFWGKTVQ